MSSVVASYFFTRDGNGRIVHATETEPLAPAPVASSAEYSYNDARNRLISAGAVAYGYDDEGQLTSAGSASYSYDYEHRLAAIGSDARFEYDGRGNRLRATRGGVVTRYIYDPWGNLLAEADGNGNITRTYIYGHGLLAMRTAGGDLYCYHFNATGSTVALTNATGGIVNSYAYDPFGNVLGQQESISQPFKFVGQYGVMAEANDSLYYMRARYYDPRVGRFISEDPIGFAGGDVNLYGYVQNDPINQVDPLGLYTQVMIWQPVGWGQSSFGHVSVDINGITYSFSPSGMKVFDTNNYMHDNQFREGIGLELNLSPCEEKKLENSLKKYPYH